CSSSFRLWCRLLNRLHRRLKALLSNFSLSTVPGHPETALSVKNPRKQQVTQRPKNQPRQQLKRPLKKAVTQRTLALKKPVKLPRELKSPHGNRPLRVPRRIHN